MAIKTVKRKNETPRVTDQCFVVCDSLRILQRKRVIIIKSRNMQANRLQAIVAGTLGYSSGLAEKERLKKFAEATELIEAVIAGEKDHPLADVIQNTMIGINALNVLRDGYEKEMVLLARQLPKKVVAWVEADNQRGFGLLSLATLVGECGSLSNYPNPAKVWRRMGLAPWKYDGKNLMGATWKSGRQGKLPAEEWEKFGYSPRRRSISFLFGENIVKQNHGEYRSRYDYKKKEIKGIYPDYSDLRCHRHGMLVATKLLLKNLWVVWNG